MTIKEVADKFNLTNDTLRYYEKVGLIGPIKKTSSGIRNYTEDDLNRIEFVKCMRDASLPIDALVKYIKLFEQGDKTLLERKKILEKQKIKLENKIRNMQAGLDKLNYKIKLYEKELLCEK